MALRQKVLVPYLSSSALDSGVVAWANYDGSFDADYWVTRVEEDAADP